MRAVCRVSLLVPSGRFRHGPSLAGAVPLPGDRPMSTASLSTAQESFTVHLHAVEKAARFAFRRLRPQEREEALAEARAAAWQAWHGLVKRGKDPVEVGVHGIANNAIRTARRSGRNGNWTSGRRTTNVRPAKSRAVRGFHVISLDGGVPER